MSIIKKNLTIFIFFIVISPSLSFSGEMLIHLKGTYFAYSYDYRQIYGEGVEFEFLLYSVSCQFIKIDVPSRIFYAYGNVVLKKGDEMLVGDELFFSPHENKGTLVSYKDKIEVMELGGREKETLFRKNGILNELNLLKIQKSFIYFTCQSIEMTPNFDIYGYNVISFVEGLESVGFKKLKLSGGIKQSKEGISIDKIWYTRSQGIIGRASYIYKIEKKFDSLTQLNYEERSVLKNYQGLERQVDIMSTTKINISKSLNFRIMGNYNSSSLWNTRLLIDKSWSDRVNTVVDITYNKPINLKAETWFGVASNINAGRFGRLSFSGKYETQNQILSNFSYSNTFSNKIDFRISSSYSQLRIRGSKTNSKIFSSGINVSYNSKIFNLSTDYYLNHDLFGNQLLSRPRLRIGINPINFYDGLLLASLYNVFIYNRLRINEIHKDSYSNNTVLNLSTHSIFIQKSLSLNFNVSLEQFIEKQGRNFTSGGFIVNVNKDLAKGISLEGFYSIQSRRKTRGWLIEGTTGQDFSTILKVNPSKSLNGWVSFSFDPKKNQWRQSFADISIGIIKNWKFHSLVSYDFILRKINNIDLYLIRQAGRFQLRFIWRSISKQFLVELVPG